MWKLDLLSADKKNLQRILFIDRKFFCIVQCSRIIFQSIKDKNMGFHFGWSHPYYQITGIEHKTDFYIRKYRYFLQRLLLHRNLQSLKYRHLNFNRVKILHKISLQYFFATLRVWMEKKVFRKFSGINEKILAFQNSPHHLLYWSHWYDFRQ